jgi:hypothetical protein
MKNEAHTESLPGAPARPPPVSELGPPEPPSARTRAPATPRAAVGHVIAVVSLTALVVSGLISMAGEHVAALASAASLVAFFAGLWLTRS